MKFTRGWDEGYNGAEEFVDGSDPFYGLTESGIIILDKSGITYFEYDAELEKEFCFEQKMELNDFSANFIVNSLETLNETELNNWLEIFKTHRDTTEEVY